MGVGDGTVVDDDGGTAGMDTCDGEIDVMADVAGRDDCDTELAGAGPVLPSSSVQALISIRAPSTATHLIALHVTTSLRRLSSQQF
jgi:hypothetical protein